jgi:SAM-dependent methyltransferase
VPDVYATSRGPLGRLASPIAARTRARRHAQLFGRTGVRPGMRVLDVGPGALGLRGLEPDLDITGVDLHPRAEYPGPIVQADASEHLPFEDGAFDLAYCSSVIEHVPRDRRPRLAAELRRVARGLYVQTPAWEFPVEPHALLPLAHWLPAGARRRYWALGAAPWEPDLALLRRRELRELFGVDPVPERLGPLVKSWVVVRPVAGGA